jgi:hypothetical protein
LIPNVVRNTFSNPTTAAIYSEEKGLSLNEINTLIGKGELRGYSHRKILYIERTNQDALEIALSKRGPMVPNRPGEPAAPKIEHYDAENKNGESTSYTAAKEITPKITATKNPFEPEPSDKSLKTTGDDGIKIAPDHQHTSKLRLTELSELATGIGLKVCTVIGSPSGDYYTIDRGRDCLERCDSLEEVEKVLTYISVSQSESPATWTIINDSLKAVPGISLPNYEVSPIIHCRHSDPNIGEINFGSELTCRQCNFSGPFPVTKPISDGFWGRSRNACPQCGSVFILNFDIRVGSDGADVYFYTDAETSGTMASTFKYPLLVIQEFH